MTSEQLTERRWQPPSGWRLAAWCVAAIVATAVLDRCGAAFEVASGVAVIYPAAASVVVSSVLLGWWGVASAFVGLLLLPWGLADTPGRVLFFAASAAIAGVVPVVVGLRPRGDTEHRTVRFLLWGAVANTLASAVVGMQGVQAVAWPPLDLRQTAEAFSGWFFGDLTAVLVLGIPMLLLLEPRLLLAPPQAQLLHGWTRRRRLHAALAVMVAGAVVVMEVVVGTWGISLHWLAMLFLPPVLVAAATGGVGAGLLVNGFTGILYVAEILHLTASRDPAALFRDVFSGYLNLVAFALAAVVTGVYSGRSKLLVTELDAHRRLLQENFERVVTALAAAIEAKDSTTEGHVQRVAKLVVSVGRKLGISGRRLEILRYAAILHDVGKIGVPEHILNKPGGLTPEEFKVLERHVTIGVDILSTIDILAPAIPFIRYHQERWDGQTDCRYPGYFGLAGEDIPLEARIIAAVDAFDAMTNDRPYRRAIPRSEALAELKREAGRQFDPQVIEVLVGILEGRIPLAPSGRWPVLGEPRPQGAPD